MAVTLLWIRDHYDANKNCYIDESEATAASADYPDKITMEELFAVLDAHDLHTPLPAYTTPPSAKGEIVNPGYPATAIHGTDIVIACSVKNTGESTGTFNVELYEGATQIGGTPSFSQSAGTTSRMRGFSATVPSTGTGVTYTLKCIRDGAVDDTETFTIALSSPPGCPDPTCSDISTTNDAPKSGEQVRLYADWDGGDGHVITSASWDFGDGTVSTVANPYKIWTNPTSYSVVYTVRLVVKNDCGKQKAVTKDITVAPPYVPPPTNGGDPSSIAIPKSLEVGDYNIKVEKSGYEIVTAKTTVSSSGLVSCTDAVCLASGYPRVVASASSVRVYMAEGVAVSDVCTWITSIGGWRNLSWADHVLEAYYVYIGAAGHSVGFLPVTWDDVLVLYYYYIGSLSSAESKSGCGFT